MKLLNEIIEKKRSEIIESKRKYTIRELVDFELYQEERRSLKKALIKGTGIIAEYKRSSPSAGHITSAGIDEVLGDYMSNNVSALSILTDQHFFKGQVEDLKAARKYGVPILRKDFIIDEFQLFEAKAFGADAVLLIAEVLDSYHVKYLCQIAQSLNLEVLVEFHSEKELFKVPSSADIIGINNRNLDTLETSIENCKTLLPYLPLNAFKIAESGIKSLDEIEELYELGFNGCLIGESLLKEPRFRTEIRSLKSPENFATCA